MPSARTHNMLHFLCRLRMSQAPVSHLRGDCCFQVTGMRPGWGPRPAWASGATGVLWWFGRLMMVGPRKQFFLKISNMECWNDLTTLSNCPCYLSYFFTFLIFSACLVLRESGMTLGLSSCCCWLSSFFSSSGLRLWTGSHFALRTGRREGSDV